MTRLLRPPDAVLLGFVQGPAELLPVSSSGHVAAARALWGLEGDDVALHAGSLAALFRGRREEAREIVRRRSWRRVGMHLFAGGIPVAVGLAAERQVRSLPVVPGLLVGSALLLSAERAGGSRTRWEAGVADGVWLGLAQAAALWPGVSRNGATLAMARFRGFARAEANPLSREVGVPVTFGAVALRGGELSVGALASFASAYAAMPLLDVVDRGGPLWPWAAERLGLALLLLRESRR